MLKWLLMLTAVVSLRGEGLGPGPQPGEGQEQAERKQVKRNWFYGGYYPVIQYPQPNPYTPFQQVQPLVVHHLVVMQSPTCQPAGNVPYLPPFQNPDKPQTPVTTTPSVLNRGSFDTEPQPKKPSKCVWAIVACCSPDSTAIRYSCFELLGCPGSFWGVNPCKAEVVQAAANTALKYYMSGEDE
ncbi:unnamed protein product [Nezara viridula]|uniref:Neuropeptide n=1 Tax=Nezara viridula TaxID=85310 RepID=A0A9P0MTI7_NEZVI|nr:unnamed protein product [Nezara viridula]